MPFPVQKIEYGSYLWLRREIGGYMGFGWDEALWDHEQAGLVESVIQSGQEQFEHPPPLPSEEPQPPHRWSFLTPVAELVLASGQKVYELPENCSGIVGEFTVQE